MGRTWFALAILLTVPLAAQSQACMGGALLEWRLQRIGAQSWLPPDVDTGSGLVSAQAGPNALVQGVLTAVSDIGCQAFPHDTSKWCDLCLNVFLCPTTSGCPSVAYASTAPFHIGRRAFSQYGLDTLLPLQDTAAFAYVDSSYISGGAHPERLAPAVGVSMLPLLGVSVSPPDLVLVVRSKDGRLCLVRVLSVETVSVQRGDHTIPFSRSASDGVGRFMLNGARLPSGRAKLAMPNAVMRREEESPR